MITEPSRTLVIGGGAAGLMAAIQAAEGGSAVVLLEGSQELGRKILISGNGRCNLLNVDGDDPSHYHGSQPRFVRPSLAVFPVQEALRFFTELGIETKQEKRGRLFPRSDTILTDWGSCYVPYYGLLFIAKVKPDKHYLHYSFLSIESCCVFWGCVLGVFLFAAWRFFWWD